MEINRKKYGTVARKKPEGWRGKRKAVPSKVKSSKTEIKSGDFNHYVQLTQQVPRGIYIQVGEGEAQNSINLLSINLFVPIGQITCMNTQISSQGKKYNCLKSVPYYSNSLQMSKHFNRRHQYNHSCSLGRTLSTASLFPCDYLLFRNIIFSHYTKTSEYIQRRETEMKKANLAMERS